MADIIKRLEAQINRMTTDGEVEQAGKARCTGVELVAA